MTSAGITEHRATTSKRVGRLGTDITVEKAAAQCVRFSNERGEVLIYIDDDLVCWVLSTDSVLAKEHMRTRVPNCLGTYIFKQKNGMIVKDHIERVKDELETEIAVRAAALKQKQGG